MFWDQAVVVAPRWNGFAPGFRFHQGASGYHPRPSHRNLRTEVPSRKRDREEVPELTTYRPFNSAWPLPDPPKNDREKVIVAPRKRDREEAPELTTYRPVNPAWPNLPALPKNDREKVMLVFDCNGTLTSLTEVRKSRGFGVRPGAGRLSELVTSKRFSVALWTSAMKSNMEKMRQKIEAASHTKFACALDRSHCVPAPTDVLRKKKHETVKPLHEYFGEGPGPGLSKVILIDDNADKVLESESANLLLIPAWREARDDQVLAVLVEGLMALDCTKDVRPQIKPIQDAVWQYFRSAYPHLDPSLHAKPSPPSSNVAATLAATPMPTETTSDRARAKHTPGKSEPKLDEEK